MGNKNFYALLMLYAITIHDYTTPTNSIPIDITITIQEGAGFFAELHKVVQTIIHFENRGIARVYVDWTDEFFPYKNKAHENGWDLYFEPIPTSHFSGKTEKITVDTTSLHHELHDQNCTAPWIAYKKYLPYRQFVHAILNKYIKIKPPVTNYVNNFYETKMKNKICIGVHARMAKVHAWLVPGKKLPTLEDYFAEVDTLITQYANQKVIIFIASDSHHAVGQFKKRYGEKALHIDANRSNFDKDPCIMYTQGEFMKEHPEIWHKKKHAYNGGLGTLIDCLLLSKCNYLIHTTSNLAFFACYFNPELESIYLPKTVPFKDCRYKDNPQIKNKLLNPL